MKHLLIIFSILLLSSFLTSCEKKEKTLYFWKTSSGHEWKEIGDKDTQIQYRGFVDDGYPEGLGVMTSPSYFPPRGEVNITPFFLDILTFKIS